MRGERVKEVKVIIVLLKSFSLIPFQFLHWKLVFGYTTSVYPKWDATLIYTCKKISIDTTFFPTQKYKILYHPTSVFWFRITILPILPTSNYFYTGTVFGLNPATGRNLNQILIISFFPLFFFKKNAFERKTKQLSALVTSQITSYIRDDIA